MVMRTKDIPETKKFNGKMYIFTDMTLSKQSINTTKKYQIAKYKSIYRNGKIYTRIVKIKQYYVLYMRILK